jgi:hypothetical protein
MVAIVPTAKAAEIQLALAVLVQIVQLVQKPTVLQLAVPTTVTVHLVVATPAAVAVNARQVIPLTVWEHASKTLFTLTGLAMATAMMVRIFLRTMVMEVLQVLLSISTAKNLIAMVVTVLVTVVANALPAKSKTVTATVAQPTG